MQAYFINLQHRTDRLAQIQAELTHQGFEPIRIDAVYVPECGPLGCTLSHIKALETFLESGVGDHCIVFEDDFMFTTTPEQTKAAMSDPGLDWDVILFAANILKYAPVEGRPDLFKAVQTLTASGYKVHRRYVPTLLANYKEGLAELISTGWVKYRALDVYWQLLQQQDNWYMRIIGRQRPGYSDIEKGVRDYGV
jgi:GR25 family glycosyltransferase involved in LPS biosynthesis